MGLLSNFNMKYKIKTQFLLFFILSFIVSVILLFVPFGLLMFSFDNKRTAYNIEKTFNKHYKGNTDAMYKNSSGSGLYICKLIVEKHGGEILAYNNEKGGATIKILLPTRHSDSFRKFNQNFQGSLS